MKVKIIGTGSMWTKNNSACYLIDDDIMIDFPNGACKYLYRNNIVPNSINNILLTHFHGDHYFDMPFYILNKAKGKNKNINIYCSKEGKGKIKKIGLLAFPNSFIDACNDTNIIYNYGNSFKIREYEISKLLVDHGRMKPAYGYVFKNNEIYVGFTGDSAYCDSVEYMASKCKYLFCDCMFIDGTTKHMGINNLKTLLSKYPDCTFIVTHLEDSTRKELEKMKNNNLIVPEDYMEFNL